MTHTAGFHPPEYDSPQTDPSGSNTRVDGVSKNFDPQPEPPFITPQINGVDMGATHDNPPAAPPAFTHSVDGVAFAVSRDGHEQPPHEPPAFTDSVDGVPFENSRDGHDQPLTDPDGGSWTLTPS